MSTVLMNLAAFMGIILFVISFFSGIANGVSFMTILFRSTIVLCVSTVFFTAFFRHFNVVLFRFLNQKLEERLAEEAEGDQTELEENER